MLIPALRGRGSDGTGLQVRGEEARRKGGDLVFAGSRRRGRSLSNKHAGLAIWPSSEINLAEADSQSRGILSRNDGSPVQISPFRQLFWLEHSQELRREKVIN